MKNLGLWNIACIIAVFCVATAIASPAKTFTVVANFNGKNGAEANGRLVQGANALMQATNGTLYGPTGFGGADFRSCIAGGGCGDVFSWSVGLGPFVETNPTSGKVGRAVTILGSNLTGATNVNFNGTVAMFTIVSRTEIKTTMPAGATTGFVEATTPEKTLKQRSFSGDKVMRRSDGRMLR
jgi:large repetitive protein